MQIMVKKGQLKIQEMSFMLLAVMLFFILVGLFLLSISFSGIKESATELCEENALLLASKIANSPEFSCGESFGTTKTNCIDADKVIALIENSDEYKNFWGVSNIEIRKIYPEFSTEVLCKRENYPNCNVMRIFPEEEIEGVYVSNYALLCRKEYFKGLVGGGCDSEEIETVEEIIYDECELAKIMINYEYGKEC